MKALWGACLLLVGVTAWGQDAAQADEPMTTLQVKTRVVEIAAVVKGKDGEVRGGLTKDDFVLKQDGKDEAIRYFSQGSELPLTLALMVDTSGSQRTFIGDETLASDVFFDAMLGRKQDRAMLVQFDNSVVPLHGLTASAGQLHLALEGLSSRAATVGGTLLDDAVWVVAKNALAKETGRKAMVILSDGGDNGSRHSLDEAIEAAQRGDVVIYSVLYSAFEGPGGDVSRAGADRGGCWAGYVEEAFGEYGGAGFYGVSNDESAGDLCEDRGGSKAAVRGGVYATGGHCSGKLPQAGVEGEG